VLDLSAVNLVVNLVVKLRVMLILASASPRRHELLLAAGLDHVVRPSHVPELRGQGEAAEDFVQRLAREKANAVAAGPGDVVLAADTVVCLEENILGKPDGPSDAIRMLRALAGREHRVLTGICLRHGGRFVADLSTTTVWFEPIGEAELLAYVATGEPFDKAGAYAIQGYASRFVRKIEGCYHNVVGLPISLVYRHLNCL
jgi:septum formation protein